MLSCCLGVTLKLLVINISSSSAAVNKICRLLPAISVTTWGTVVGRRCIDNTWPVAALTARSEARIGWESRFLPTTPAPNRGVPVGILPWRLIRKKLEWCGYRMVKKNLKICLFVLTEFTKVTNRRTYTHRETDTAWRNRSRLHLASRSKTRNAVMNIFISVCEKFWLLCRWRTLQRSKW